VTPAFTKHHNFIPSFDLYSHKADFDQHFEQYEAEVLTTALR
jgi:hypothetical protein